MRKSETFIRRAGMDVPEAVGGKSLSCPTGIGIDSIGEMVEISMELDYTVSSASFG